MRGELASNNSYYLHRCRMIVNILMSNDHVANMHVNPFFNFCVEINNPPLWLNLSQIDKSGELESMMLTIYALMQAGYIFFMFSDFKITRHITCNVLLIGCHKECYHHNKAAAQNGCRNWFIKQ